MLFLSILSLSQANPATSSTGLCMTYSFCVLPGEVLCPPIAQLGEPEEEHIYGPVEVKVFLPSDADEDEGEHFGVGEIVLDLRQEIGEMAGRDCGLEEAAQTDTMASTKSIPSKGNFQDNIKCHVYLCKHTKR